MKYPLTGFSKISWEELLGIMETLKLFGSLDDKSKDAIMLMMDGLKYRSMSEGEKCEPGLGGVND